MADAVGNVLRPPGTSAKGPTTDDEILASYVGFTQKGLTIEAGSGYLKTGTVLRAGATAGKYRGATKAGSITGLTSDEVQTVTITGGPTGGTFTLTFSGQTTAAIAYNATAAAVRTALEALSNIGAGNVATAGGPFPGTAVTVTFQGTLADTNQPQMTATGSFTGGTTPAVAVTTTTEGGTTGTASETPLAVLRKDVDATTGDMLANYVLHGSLKGSKIKFTDDEDGLSVKELQSLAKLFGGHYNPIHDILSY